MITDSIADMLIRIKNAQSAGKETVERKSRRFHLMGQQIDGGVFQASRETVAHSRGTLEQQFLHPATPNKGRDSYLVFHGLPIVCYCSP